MATILLVSEPDGDVRDILERHVSWELVEANSGAEALSILDEAPVSLCLTDAELPDMSQDEFLGTLRDRFSGLPVVLLTRSAGEGTVRGLRFGAATYVPRSRLARDLVTTVKRVLALCEEREGEAEALAQRERATVVFEIENDVSAFRPIVTHLTRELERFGLASGNERIFAGVALEEALLNAMVHGNLEIDSDVREESFVAFDAHVEERRRESPYRERKIHVEGSFDRERASFTIRDEGHGFDVSSVPDPQLPENVLKASGRGLLLMRSFMDEVVYNEKGNEVRLVKRRSSGTG